MVEFVVCRVLVVVVVVVMYSVIVSGDSIENPMTIFDVKHIHSVTYVAPLATKPRLAITGWFMA